VSNPTPTARPDVASEVAAQFLAAAANPAVADRGWSLNHPEIRRDMFNDDRAAWIRAASTTDWDSFEWSIEEVVPDDPFLYFVYLDIADEHPAPDVLVKPHNLLTFLTGVDPRERPHLSVRLGPNGEGMWAAGG
jgi:hypothetical protein